MRLFSRGSRINLHLPLLGGHTQLFKWSYGPLYSSNWRFFRPHLPLSPKKHQTSLRILTAKGVERHAKKVSPTSTTHTSHCHLNLPNKGSGHFVEEAFIFWPEITNYTLKEVQYVSWENMCLGTCKLDASIETAQFIDILWKQKNKLIHHKNNHIRSTLITDF